MSAFELELRRTRSLLAWLAVALLGYGAVMGAMYPVLRDATDLLDEYMKLFPREFIAAFGMTGNLASPGVFFTTYIASWLWPIIGGGGAIWLATRPAADMDRGFLDLPLSTRLSRTRHLLAAIGSQVLLMAVLAIAAIGGLWVVGRLVGGEFDLGRFALAGSVAFGLGCAIAAFTTMVAVLTLRRGLAAGIAAGLLIAMYLVDVVSRISSDWAWIGPLSPLNHFDATAIIDGGESPLGPLLLFGAAAVGLWALALAAFRRRDLAV